MEDARAETAPAEDFVAGYVLWLEAQGHSDTRLIGKGRYATLCKMMFTHAILIGKIGDFYGYDDRWCYHSYANAKAALDAWDGVGEPQGWHRHPATGRRVVEHPGEEFDDRGQRVDTIGTTYVRA